MRILLTIVVILTATNSLAGEGNWLFMPGDYTHDPYTGKRVTQFAPDPTAYYAFGRNYQKSGYRYNNSTLRIGNSADRYSTVETWGNGAVALGSTLLFQPYDERGDDTLGFDHYRRYRRRLHEDYHGVHRRGHHRHARDIDDQDDDGDSRHGRRGHGGGKGRSGKGHRDHFVGGPGIGWGIPPYGPVYPGFGPGTPGFWPGNGAGYGWGGGGWGGGGWGAGGWGGWGGGFGAAGSTGNHGRIQWDKDAGSVEWGLDQDYFRSGYGYGWGGGWGDGWGGGRRGHGGHGGHRPRPSPHGGRR